MKIFSEIKQKFGKMMIGLFLAMFAAFGSSAWEYYYYGELLPAYTTGALALIYSTAFLLEYKK